MQGDPGPAMTVALAVQTTFMILLVKGARKNGKLY